MEAEIMESWLPVEDKKPSFKYGQSDFTEMEIRDVELSNVDLLEIN